jgi:hypothetical protein
MLIRSAVIVSVLHLAFATSATATKNSPVRVCFDGQPATAVLSDSADLYGGPAKVARYAVQVTPGQHLRIELQPTSQSPADKPWGHATLSWPDGNSQVLQTTQLFDGTVEQRGDLLVSIARTTQGTSYFRLTLTTDRPTACSATERLERFVGKDPSDMWKAEPALKQRLRRLLGRSYAAYNKRNETIMPIEKVNGALYAQGCQSHMCGVEAAELYITIPDGKLHCLLVFDGKRAQVFSEDPAHLPAGLVATQAAVGK